MQIVLFDINLLQVYKEYTVQKLYKSDQRINRSHIFDKVQFISCRIGSSYQPNHLDRMHWCTF